MVTSINAFSAEIKPKDTVLPLTILTGYTASAPMMLFKCTYNKVMDELVYTSDKAECALGTIGALSITSSVAFLKQMYEVQPDAINYEIDGSITPALESVVETFQESATLQNATLSFEDVINLIVSLE